MNWMLILLALAWQSVPKLDPKPDVHLAAGIYGARALEKPTAGISLAVNRAGATHVLRSFGFADVDRKVPVTSKTMFRIGAVSRQIEAAVALKLVDEGTLTLEPDLARWLRDLSTATGPSPVARAIEQAVGQSYGDYLRQKLFEPLRMLSTSVCAAARVYGTLAAGHDVSGGALTASPAARPDMDATEICSTAPDLITWQRMLESGRIVSKARVEQMRADGLGTRLRSLPGHRAAGVVASTGGFSAAIAFFPDDKLTVVVLTNTSNDSAEAIATAIARSEFELGMSAGPDLLFSEPAVALSGNPILQGFYADPEAHVFENEYWIYPTYSAPYNQQTFMDAFSSRDLVTWTKHPRILDAVDVTWAKRAMWAPSIVEKDGWYYLFFGANDIQNDQEAGGIGVARARQPGGPFKDYLGKPLIDKFHNGAQPIDQFVFKDRDGAYYIVYGGWRHCNIARMNDDFTGLVPFPDGSTFKEITPQGYVEGAFMLIKDGKYYFMWSEGGWTGPNYAVAYAVGSSPFGPFERVGKILEQDPAVATGAGHHSVLHVDGSGKWYIVYHRRPLGDTDRNHRVVCIDELKFDANGMIVPVKITTAGVAADPLPARR